MRRRNKTSRWGNFVKKTEQTSKTWDQGDSFQFTFHNDSYTSEDILLKKDLFPGIAVNDVIEIVVEGTPPFVVKVNEQSFEKAKNVAVSIKQTLCTVFGIQQGNSNEVKVRKPEQKIYEIDMVVLSFSNQWISRRNMWYST